MNTLTRTSQIIARSPIFWGAIGMACFYALIQAGPLDYPIIRRYLMGHPVEYLETGLFSIGLATLVLKALDLKRQVMWPAVPSFDIVNGQSNARTVTRDMLDEIDRLPTTRQADVRIRLLRDALGFVARRGSSEGLDDELKFLADAEATRLHNGHALFRVVVWAIPILGFLGTVIGITMALNSVDLNAPQDSMVHVLTGLGLKFDTTALALMYAVILMFLHFYIDQQETALLAEADHHVTRVMTERFPSLPTGPDGQLLVVRRMAETVVQAAEQLVDRQTELWRASMDAAAERWTGMAEMAGRQLQTALGGALREGVEQSHARTTATLVELQETVARQIDLLEKTVKATGEVTSLEDTLNRNLAALSGAKNFEQTVMALAAAVNLLSARLTDAAAASVKLEPSRKAARAA